MKAAPVLDALALSPLTARAVSPVRLAPVFAPCGARPPACWAAPKASSPAVGHLAWSRCRTTLPGRSTPQAGGLAPLRGSDGRGLRPHQTPPLGRLKTLGRFVFGGSPGPSVRPAWAGATSGAAPRQRLASWPLRCARTAATTLQKACSGYWRCKKEANKWARLGALFGVGSTRISKACELVPPRSRPLGTSPTPTEVMFNASKCMQSS